MFNRPHLATIAFCGARRLWPGNLPSRRTILFGLGALPAIARAESLPSLEQRIFSAINFQRVEGDCEPLAWDQALCLTAREHSRRMIEAGFFGHVDPSRGDLTMRMDGAGIPWARCAENVFREKDFSDPVAIAVVEWMYSRGHRANILTAAFTRTGVGVATDDAGTFVATQQFLLPPRALEHRSQNRSQQ